MSAILEHKRVSQQHPRVPFFAKNAQMGMGKRIKALRDEKGWTLEELAKRSGVKETTISMLEQRDSKKSDHAPKIADAFGVIERR